MSWLRNPSCVACVAIVLSTKSFGSISSTVFGAAMVAAKSFPMSNIRTKPEWRRGHAGEVKVARFLRDRGHFVVMVKDGAIAPTMVGATDKIVLPDLLVSKDGATKFCEVKSQTPSFTRRHGRYEVSINTGSMDHYRQCERVTGIPVYLAFVIDDDIRFTSLSAKSEHRGDYHWYPVGKLSTLGTGP